MHTRRHDVTESGNHNMRNFFRIQPPVSAQDGPIALERPIHTLILPASEPPQGCTWNNTSVGLIEHRSLPTMEGEMSTTFYPKSSFFQVIIAVMLWSFRFWKFLKPLSTTALLSCSHIHCACKSISLVRPFDSGVARPVDPQ